MLPKSQSQKPKHSFLKWGNKKRMWSRNLVTTQATELILQIAFQDCSLLPLGFSQPLFPQTTFPFLFTRADTQSCWIWTFRGRAPKFVFGRCPGNFGHQLGLPTTDQGVKVKFLKHSLKRPSTLLNSTGASLSLPISSFYTGRRAQTRTVGFPTKYLETLWLTVFQGNERIHELSRLPIIHNTQYAVSPHWAIVQAEKTLSPP